MTIALPVNRPSFARSRTTRAVRRPVALTGHPHGDAPLGSAPAAPLVVVLLGMLVVGGGLVSGAVLLVVGLLRALLG